MLNKHLDLYKSAIKDFDIVIENVSDLSSPFNNRG
jgi:hypothetical protein